MPLRLITLPHVPSSWSSCLDHVAVNNMSAEDASSDGGTVGAVFLGSHHLGDRGVERIVDGLEDSCRLYYRIHLDNNQVTRKGAQLISCSLKHCPTLLELSLADNPLSNEGARHLASSLMCNNTLEMLNISNCGIGPSGVDALSYALEHNNASLRWLDLSSNPMGDAGSQSMLRCIANERSFDLLLSCNHSLHGIILKKVTLEDKRRTLSRIMNYLKVNRKHSDSPMRIPQLKVLHHINENPHKFLEYLSNMRNNDARLALKLQPTVLSLMDDSSTLMVLVKNTPHVFSNSLRNKLN